MSNSQDDDGQSAASAPRDIASSSQNQASQVDCGPDGHAMVGSYRRSSFVTMGPRPAVFQTAVLQDQVHLNDEERARVIETKEVSYVTTMSFPPRRGPSGDAPPTTISYPSSAGNCLCLAFDKSKVQAMTTTTPLRAFQVTIQPQKPRRS